MIHAELGDAAIAVQFRGAGKPLLLIHGTVLADGLLPLAEALRSRREHLILRYHRRGYGRSSRMSVPWSVEQHAKDAARLLEHLALQKADVVGYSAGAAVALQMALDFPRMTGAVVLIEPWFSAQAPQFQAFESKLAAIQGIYEYGDTAAAMQEYLTFFCGPDYRNVLDNVFSPRWLEMANRDAHTIFVNELSALRLWRLDRGIAERLTTPLLLVRGSRTSPYQAEVHAELAEWLPEAETVVVPDAGHLVPTERPAALARSIARFLVRNPLHIAASAG
ncbi:MAG TPA: alpha/beta hydrolase [Terriglobales bacterium]|nr:alpha/beta hydrolase [Terriglobales bacterium]